MNIAGDGGSAGGVEGAVAVGPLALVGEIGGGFAEGPAVEAGGAFVNGGAARAGGHDGLNEAAREAEFAGIPGFEGDLGGVEVDEFAFELVVVGEANDASVGGV